MNADPSRQPQGGAAAGEGGRSTAMEPRDRSPVELGRRIKMLRIARSLTLKDIETRGGISATHVSEIERGKASPTVGALGRIAQALGVRPACIVEPRLLPEVTLVRGDETSGVTLQWGTIAVRAMSEPTQDAQISLHAFTLPPARDPVLEHQHDGEEWVMVSQGVAEVRVDGRAYVLREGDALHFHGVRPHSYGNLGSSPATLLVASRPRLGF